MNASTLHGAVSLRAWILGSLLVVASCGGGKATLVVPNPSTPTGLPTPPAPAASNTYLGVQSPGAWTFTLDDTKNTFSYQSTTYPASPNSVAGDTQQVNGFLRLTANGNTVGYALEVQGRFAILRPGDATASPVLGVPQTTCYTLVGRSRFEYIALPAAPVGALNAAPVFGYGSVVASTDSAGKSWQFIDLQGNVVSGPASFSGACGAASQASISFSGGQSVLDNSWAGVAQTVPTPGTQSVLSVGPSGFFVADQSDANAGQPTGASVAGVIEPTTALSSTDVTSQQYNGFWYQPATALGLNGVPAPPPYTSPVSFGQPGVTGPSLTGGTFPGDDVLQLPQTNITLVLGKQDTSYNGLYSAASITLSDPAQNCANYTGPGNNSKIGIDAQGYPTCTISALAIVGNPEGKYAIFVSSFNWAARLGGAPLQLYLLQR